MSIKEIDIIEGCIRKDPKAQRALYDLYARKCYATCLRYLVYPNSAKDALQESFISAFKYIKGYDKTRGKLQNWLIKICVNECLKTIRKNKPTLTIDHAHDLNCTDNQGLLHLDAEYVYDAILKLPEHMRTIFNMHSVEGFKHKEIAELLGIAESSSRSTLTRAKKLLRGYISSTQKESTWKKEA